MIESKNWPYIVIGMPRTGSNLLFDLLRNDIKDLFEFFSPYRVPFVDGDKVKFKKKLNPVSFIDTKEMVRRMCIIEQFDTFSFKLFSFHLDAPTYEGDVQSNIKNHVLVDFIRQRYQVVHLSREDKIAQFLSEIKAMRTGVWYIKSGDVVIEPEPIRITRASFDSFREKLLHFEYLKQALPAEISLTYEDLSQDLTKFFPSWKPVDISYQKQHTNYDWVQNLDEVKGWFEEISSI